MHVSRSLSGRNAESTQVHGLHSGVGGTSYIRDWHAKLREVLRCQAAYAHALIHHCAQFEGDALRCESNDELTSV